MKYFPYLMCLIQELISAQSRKLAFQKSLFCYRLNFNLKYEYSKYVKFLNE